VDRIAELRTNRAAIDEELTALGAKRQRKPRTEKKRGRPPGRWRSLIPDLPRNRKPITEADEGGGLPLEA
jgi:hypothetical protein